MSEKLNFSSIIERGFTILGRNLAGALLLAILLAGLPGMFLQSQFPTSGQLPQNPGPLLLGSLLASIGQALLVGTLLYAVFRHMLGLAPASIGLLLSYGSQIALSGVLVALAAAFITGLALLIFAVPGMIFSTLFLVTVPAVFLIFSVLFFVAVPAAIIERLSVGEALRRSIQLTEGFRWSLAGYVSIVWIATSLIGWIVGIAFRFVGLEDVALVVISSLAAAFTSIVVGLIYHDLRRLKDGATAEDMVQALK